jgi:DNA repair protein RecN (Recombination protein N)
LQKELAAVTDIYLARARELSRGRRHSASRFGQQIEALLGELAMTRARFEVRFNQTELPPEAWNSRGIDEAEFFLSPNPGEDLRPLARIVSGGELSRVMLALKTLTACVEPRAGTADVGTKTLIFDEVDAGIGGRVADTVGAQLATLGERFQVLCITHLPQIAARARTQFRIEKVVRRERTVASVHCLNEEGRVEELARMIGGANVTEPVRASAQALLEAGRADSRGERHLKAKGKKKA